MARVPQTGKPYDPAQAARDRAAQNLPLTPLTKQQRTVRKHGLRPLPAVKPDDAQD
jgi:hypothetical protein